MLQQKGYVPVNMLDWKYWFFNILSAGFLTFRSFLSLSNFSQHAKYIVRFLRKVAHGEKYIYLSFTLMTGRTKILPKYDLDFFLYSCLFICLEWSILCLFPVKLCGICLFMSSTKFHFHLSNDRSLSWILFRKIIAFHHVFMTCVMINTELCIWLY